jgi:hypothetical protein
MGRDLDPERVAARLRVLAEIYVAETVEEARVRLRADAMRPDVFATQVARNLEELRALDELARYLHRHIRFERLTSLR